MLLINRRSAEVSLLLPLQPGEHAALLLRLLLHGHGVEGLLIRLALAHRLPLPEAVVLGLESLSVWGDRVERHGATCVAAVNLS